MSPNLPDIRVEIAVVVERELQQLLAEQSDLPDGAVLDADRRLWIELRPGPIPGADDVLIRIEAQLEGQLLAESLTESCLSCTDEQVAQKALSMLQPLLEEFPAVERREVPPPSPSALVGTDTGELAGPRPRDPLLISGATTLGLGVVGIGLGAALIVANESLRSDPGKAQIDVIKYRDPGIGVTVASGALAITGAALLGVALAKRNRRGNVAAAPMLAPNLHGIGVVGRF